MGALLTERSSEQLYGEADATCSGTFRTLAHHASTITSFSLGCVKLRIAEKTVDHGVWWNDLSFVHLLLKQDFMKLRLAQIEWVPKVNLES